MHARTAVPTAVAVSLLTATFTFASGSSAGADEPSPALQHARAILGATPGLIGAEFVEQPAARSAMVVSATVAGFPTAGGTYSVLTSGDAALLTRPNDGTGSGAGLGGLAPGRGNSAYDATVLRIDVDVPAGTNCLLGMDFRFLSEEYPEYVGSSFNDAFIAEMDRTTWTTHGSAIDAPDNFAFDPVGNPITINTVGGISMLEEYAAGTTYDGATPMLTAATPTTPGRHSIYLSVFDQGDNALDSAVMIDNLRFGQVVDVENDCRPGAELAELNYVALGDSYSSGFGNSPYYPGTTKDAGPNDCQRSPDAYGPLVAAAVGLDLTFQACQGGVTKDFYSARAGGDWGELPQLDYLDPDTALVTFSIGGNDAEFAYIYAECVAGMELLPWNTCSNDAKVTHRLADSLGRLGGADAYGDPRLEDITPYETLFQDVLNRAPYSTRVVVGYPQFFPEGGAGTTFRCKGVKRVDQAWMYTATRYMTEELLAPEAARFGFLLADPGSRFVGHEFCSGDDWFYGITNPGKVHPTQPGQRAMADAVLDVLQNDPRPRFLVKPGETVTTTFEVRSFLTWLSTFISWPGSDVEMTLVSPSGVEYTRSSAAAESVSSTAGSAAAQQNGPTWDRIEVAEPEQGTWTVRMYGADVDQGGEEVRLSIARGRPENQLPVAAFDLDYDGKTLTLDASGSRDPDGELVGNRWFVDTGEQERVLEGLRASTPLASGRPWSVSLQVVDDRGGSTFLTRKVAAIDVKPGNDVDPVNVRSKGSIPLAVLSFPGFDATRLDPSTLRIGRDGGRAQVPGTHTGDVDHDGLDDLLVHVRTDTTGLRSTDTSLCVTGTLEDSSSFLGCDGIRAR